MGTDPADEQCEACAIVILDCHHHLWKIDRGDYHWMAQADPVLARDYLVEDLRPVLHKAGVDRTIVVQAAQTEAETDFLLGLAHDTDFIVGVTGWLDLANPRFPERLAHYRKNSKLVAVRPMLQDLPADDWILQPVVLDNLDHLAAIGFPLEFLTFPRHLPYVTQALERVPRLRAVIDHLSKPPIASGLLDPWRALIQGVARFPNVYCKLSGMVTEDKPETWSQQSISPYVDHVVSVFGVDRQMFGSDWPVCLSAAEYEDVVNVLRRILEARIHESGLDRIFRRNAEVFYQLNAAEGSAIKEA